MKNHGLNQREEDLLEIMWKLGNEQTTMSLENELAENKEWSRLNIFKTVRELMNKGYLEITGVKQNDRQIARVFRPVLTKEEYVFSPENTSLHVNNQGVYELIRYDGIRENISQKEVNEWLKDSHFQHSQQEDRTIIDQVKDIINFDIVI